MNIYFFLIFKFTYINACREKLIDMNVCILINDYIFLSIPFVRVTFNSSACKKKLKSKIFLLHRYKSYTFIIVYKDRNVSLFINKVVFMQRKKKIYIYIGMLVNICRICTILLVAFVTLKFAT